MERWRLRRQQYEFSYDEFTQPCICRQSSHELSAQDIEIVGKQKLEGDEQMKAIGLESRFWLRDWRGQPMSGVWY